jgi:hypothetical protein
LFQASEVEYHDGRLSQEVQLDLAAIAEDVESAVKAQLRRHIDALFLRKLTDWRSEHEFRVIVETEDSAPIYVDVSRFLAGVILGPDTPPEYLPAIRELCDVPRLAVWRLTWRNSDPRLAPVAFD